MPALLHLPRYTATTCLGIGLAALRAGLHERRSGLAPCDFDTVDLQTWIGTVPGVDAVRLPEALADYDCRNNRLARLAFEQDGFADAVRAASAKWGAHRVGVFLGTSTSGIYETELAYRALDPVTGALPASLVYHGSHNPYSLAGFVRASFDLAGPAVSVSSACSSSAKVFGSAWRMVEAGLIDAAVVGGVDSLCLTTLYGFGSLDVLSGDACRPFDAARRGISIGEGAAFALVERVPASGAPAGSVVLAGFGESSDAHHMSSPHPDGLGAKMAMAQALAQAGAAPHDVAYINLHGTATPANDAAEGRAVTELFGDHGVAGSSTKGATGHTLGAAGGIEAVVAALALTESRAWAGVHTREIDPSIPIDYVLGDNRPLSRDGAGLVMSNSFGFGGTNSSLVLGLAP